MEKIKGWVREDADMETLTVAGLIAELQRHIEIDPTRANDPVVVWVAGERTRLVPALAGAVGHDDPEIGGHRQVFLLALSAIPSPQIHI